MKTLLLAGVLLLTAGCASPYKLVRALAKDPATAYLRVPTPYGTVLLIRTSPGTNTIWHTIDPDGKVTVGK